MNSTRRILRFFLICIVAQGRVSKATNIYISRASGNDSWSCVQRKPCKTIWRGVSLASDGDAIYLDGTNTDQDPYSCHSTQHLGVYINKRLALIGTGPMPPQIRCSEGTRLTFDGSENTHQMNVTLSGLLVRESFIFFQDTSASIHGCKFVGSKQGVQFVIRRKMVSDFQITNSAFERNEECISVFVNSTKIESPIIHINFSLTNSSMFDNTIEDGGNHLSFTESPDNDQTVIINCLISMESVTFAHNKFSSRGLVFLQFKSGNQGLQLHEVNSSDNWPSTNKDVLKDLQGDGELVLNSTYVDIFINASSFTSQNTRELCVTASNTSIQIWNSRFYDHRVEGGGGALSVKGYNECRLFIVKSSFFNTTAVTDFDPFEPDGGGAIEAECAKLTCTLKNSIFSVNTAVNGSGGAVALGFFSSSLYDIPQTIDKKDLLVLSIENVSFSNCSADYGGSLSFVKRNDKNPFGAVINISNSHFISNEANHGSEESSVGGAILIGSLAKIMHINISVMIRGSTFVNNAAEGGGGAIFIAGVKILEIIDSFFVNNHHPIGGSGGALFITNYGNYCEHIIIKNTTFTGNFAREYGGAVRLLVDCKTEFRNSYFLDNFALFDGAHIHVEETSSLLIQDSNFTQTTNTTHYNYSSLIEVIKVVNLVLTGTRVATEAYSRDKVLMRVRLANQVSLGSDSSATEFICPSGSKIDIDCLPDRDESPCTLYVNTGVTAIQFKCSACEGNSYSLQGGRARGTMAPRVQCHSCPYGANCTQNIVAKRDFWGFKEQRNPSLLKFTMCPVGYCSQPMVENFPEYNSCQGNRSETLCGMCKHDYTETIYSTQCIPSDRCNDYWFWPIALVYVSLMALYLTFRPPLVPWIKRQILWFKENERVEQEIDFDKGYLKILFYFYQAADLFLISDSSRMLIKNCIIESVVGIFNFKSSFLNSSICPFPGLTPVTKRFFLTSHIVCTWLIICILYGVLCGVQRLRGKGKPSPGPYVGGILQTTLLGYTMLASTSLSLLRCVDISGERRLFFDGNIVCFQWWQYLLMGIACGYVVPFVFILLWGSIKFYGGTLSVRKLLSACFLPLPFLIYWSYMLLHDKIKGAVAENAPPSSDSRRYLEMILYDSFKRPEEGNKLSLCWESVMIGRRLILVALKSFVSDPLSRVIIMNLVSVLFLIHHTFALPFRDGIANIIETISLTLIVVLGSVNVFFASFVSLGVSVDDTHFRNSWLVLHVVELVILCLVPACFFLLVLLAVVSQLCRVIVVGFQVLYNVLNSFSACWKNQTEERRSLVAVAGQAHS